MSNPLKGEVAFTAGEHSFTLRFDTNALISLEEKLGVPISKIGETLAAGISVGALRSMLWAGLLAHHKLTEDETSRVMDDIGLERAGELAAEALTKAMPKADRKATAGAGEEEPARPR